MDIRACGICKSGKIKYKAMDEFCCSCCLVFCMVLVVVVVGVAKSRDKESTSAKDESRRRKDSTSGSRRIKSCCCAEPRRDRRCCAAGKETGRLFILRPLETTNFGETGDTGVGILDRLVEVRLLLLLELSIQRGGGREEGTSSSWSR